MTTSIFRQACWHASRLATSSATTSCSPEAISPMAVLFTSARRNVYCPAAERKNAEPIPPAAPVNQNSFFREESLSCHAADILSWRSEERGEVNIAKQKYAPKYGMIPCCSSF